VICCCCGTFVVVAFSYLILVSLFENTVLFSKSHSPLIIRVSIDRLGKSVCLELWHNQIQFRKFNFNNLGLAEITGPLTLKTLSVLTDHSNWITSENKNYLPGSFNFLRISLHGRKNGRRTWLPCCSPNVAVNFTVTVELELNSLVGSTKPQG